MSGLETAASIIAVLTASCQVISALHNAIKELKSLPKELTKLTSEITIIEQCVAHIVVLIEADDETFKVFQRFRFAEAIGICADTCQEFHRSFSKWASSPTQSRRAQARLWFHRKDVQSVRAEISSARETTIFTAVKIAKTHREKKAAYRRAQLDVRDMSSRAPDYSGYNLGSPQLENKGRDSAVSFPGQPISLQEQQYRPGQYGQIQPYAQGPQYAQGSQYPQEQQYPQESQYHQAGYNSNAQPPCHQGYNQPGSNYGSPNERVSTAQHHAQYAQQQSQETFNGVGKSITQNIGESVEFNGQNDEANAAVAHSAPEINQSIRGPVKFGKSSRGNKGNSVTR
ncbi:hypothetical protein IG631_14350 [Alternaria alternata]|nr:hypothetical protein IG631_14350 [Alternaria alternata]